MSKIIKLGSKARAGIKAGVDILAAAVGASLGPKGRTAIIGKSYGAPDINNDGVTIAKAIELEDPIEQLGASLVQHAANKTNDVAGDGTTSTVVLTSSLVGEGIRMVESGIDPVALRRGMNLALEKSLEVLDEMHKSVESEEEMADVATISSRSKDIGSMIAKMLQKVGKNGVVTVQSGDGNSIETELTEGMQFDKGFKSPYFVTDTQRMEAVMEHPAILVTDRKISSIHEVVKLLEQLLQSGKKDILIIAEDVDGDALANFILNKMRGTFNILAVQAPAFGDRRKAMLQDIAVLTGATFISSDLGMKLETATIDDLGSCDRVISNKDTTTLVGGSGEKSAIEARIAEITNAMQSASSDYDREKFQERLAKLSGGVGVIKVGAATEVAMKELKYLVEDALNATKAAVAEGVVSGGGSALIKVAHQLKDLKSENPDEHAGIQIVLRAMQAPFRQIAQNSGIYDISILVNDIQGSPRGGYDFLNMKMVEDMIQAGIVDPVLVTKEAMKNAVSVAGSILTTEVAIVDKPKEEVASAAPGMGGMGMDGMY
ncbi:MAG: chaperonin GroEL [Patescibacteria group bacterium]